MKDARFWTLHVVEKTWLVDEFDTPPVEKFFTFRTTEKEMGIMQAAMETAIAALDAGPTSSEYTVTYEEPDFKHITFDGLRHEKSVYYSSVWRFNAPNPRNNESAALLLGVSSPLTNFVQFNCQIGMAVNIRESDHVEFENLLKEIGITQQWEYMGCVDSWGIDWS